MDPTTSRKGGDFVCIETNTLNLINFSQTVRVAYENVGCIPFCQKVEKMGHNTRLDSLFAMNFHDNIVKLRNVEKEVQLQKDNHMSSIFHFSLIKILVKFAIDKKNIYW